MHGLKLLRLSIKNWWSLKRLKFKFMNRENFTLKKIGRTKRGGLSIHYETSEETPAGTRTDTVQRTSTEVPHPDMKNGFNLATDFITEVFYQGMVDKNKKDDAFDRVEAYQVSISGADKRKVVVSAKVETFVNRVAFNSPSTSIENNPYETNLEAMVEQLEEEAFRYLFEGKAAQLKIDTKEAA